MQVDASEKNKVTEKCLIFEKLIKENDSHELVKRINKATHEVKRLHARVENRAAKVDLESHMQETCSHMSRDTTILQTMSQRREQGQLTKEGLIVKRKYPVV